MNHEEFYKYSKLLNAYVDFAKKIVGTHYYRHSVLADSSERGIDCVYARKTVDLALTFEPGFIDMLKDNSELVPDMLIECLEELLANQTEPDTDLD
jgi:acetone carboxylase gamma subunit